MSAQGREHILASLPKLAVRRPVPNVRNPEQPQRPLMAHVRRVAWPLRASAIGTNRPNLVRQISDLGAQR
jgi:hypothetical protein